MRLFSRQRWNRTPRSRVFGTRRESAGVEGLTRQIGRELLARAAGKKPGGALSQAMMSWALKDPAFRTQLFRFIDVFPALRTPEEVHAHLVDYLERPGITLPTGMGLALGTGGLMRGALAATIGRQIAAMGRQFIAGETAAAALPALRALWDQQVAFSVDLLGEACLSDAEAAAYAARYGELLEQLPAAVAVWPANSMMDMDHLGGIQRANVSIKLSSLYARSNPQAFEASVEGLCAALRPLLELAQQRRVLLHFDMEQQAMKELTLTVFERCIETVDFPAGIAIQAYLRSSDADVARMIGLARRTGRQFAVRLIKGAYWDYEVVHAEMRGWPAPVWQHKGETDAAYERATAALVEAIPRRRGEAGIKLAIGSHNVRSIAHAIALVRQRGLPDTALEIQMLRGMAEHLKWALVASGMRVREYVPIGEMIPGMAYLVRRLLENTSNDSWLRAATVERALPEDLLAPPPAGEPGEPAPADQALSPATEGMAPFMNEPPRNFADAAQRAAFAQAVSQTRVPRVEAMLTEEQARQAVERADKAFATWRQTDVRERAQMVLRTAALLRAQRDSIAGMIIREAGKTWSEADGDVCEAIDFCEFYARAAVHLLTPRRLGRFAGEFNEQSYAPRGVAAVIAPWNFPLAILTGMTAAALVTGNSVVIKPAEQTPGVGFLLAQMFWQAGVPKGALQFAPGPGERIGAALVRDPRVALVAFTGSKAVGLEILREAARPPKEQGFIKKVVCEMGGKNAIIVDASADLDEAVAGVRQSAFGYAGQKCSACSRCIVVGPAEAFLRRLVEAVRTWKLGDPLDPATDMGPVIDEEAAEKVRRYLAIGREEGRQIYPTPADGPEPAGRLIRPHLFTGIRAEHRLAQEEIFGPVLAIMEAADFAEALELANRSDYRLTGGVYSRTPRHLELARRAFQVGDLYLNRPITGAQVGRQPFGGSGMSGIGAQAGTVAYLEQFVEPRLVCEHLLRRGFVPVETRRDETTR